MSDQSPKRLAGTLQLFIDIVRMRRGPEDLPFDRSLLAGSIVVFGVLHLAIGLLLPEQVIAPLVLVLVEIAVTLLSLRFLLQLANRSERFVQTATAMFGCQIVLAPVLLLVAWLSLHYGADGSAGQVPVLVLRLGVAIWVLAINARVMRSATGWPMGACVAMIITIEMLTLLLLMLLYPQAWTATQT